MNENDGSGFLPHECVFRKLASERLDRITELAAENGELKHQLNGVVQENEALRAENAKLASEWEKVYIELGCLRQERGQ